MTETLQSVLFQLVMFRSLNFPPISHAMTDAI